jgi:hypothetical protein
VINVGCGLGALIVSAKLNGHGWGPSLCDVLTSGYNIRSSRAIVTLELPDGYCEGDSPFPEKRRSSLRVRKSKKVVKLTSR